MDKDILEIVLNNALHLSVEHKILVQADTLNQKNIINDNDRKVINRANEIKNRRNKDTFLTKYYRNVSEPNNLNYFKLHHNKNTHTLTNSVPIYIRLIYQTKYEYTKHFLKYKPQPIFLNNSIEILTNAERTEIENQIKSLMAYDKTYNPVEIDNKKSATKNVLLSTYIRGYKSNEWLPKCSPYMRQKLRELIDNGIIKTEKIKNSVYIDADSWKSYANSEIDQLLRKPLNRKQFKLGLNSALNLTAENIVLLHADSLRKRIAINDNVKAVLNIAEKIKDRRENDPILKTFFSNVSEPNDSIDVNDSEYFNSYRWWGEKADTRPIATVGTDKITFTFTHYIFNYNPSFLDISLDIIPSEKKRIIEKQLREMLFCWGMPSI